METINLNNGISMPILGLGTWNLSGKEAENAVFSALDAGYRHVDTASVYGNEREIGTAIKKSKVSRKDIFITTKIWNSEHNDPEAALEASLKRLGMDYVDLYLIHWPVKKRTATWKVLEKLLEEGRCRAIGISNFTVNHLKELLKSAKTKPAVNQVEFSPYLYQKELLEFCRSKGIVLEAYSPLTRGRKLDDPKLAEMTAKYKKSPAQIILRWLLQHGIAAIPKSSSEKRIKENASVFDFELSEDDMKKMDSFNENFRTCWDPTGMD